MTPYATLPALVVGALAACTVYVDARRRSLPRRATRRWTAGVALVSGGGVLVAFALDGVLFRTYLAARGEPMIATSPRSLLTVTLLSGLTIGAAAVLAYGLGSRFGPLASS